MSGTDEDPEAASPAAGSPTALAGWYVDPNGEAEKRWWDGDAWTAHVHGTPTVAQPQTPVATPGASTDQDSVGMFDGFKAWWTSAHRTTQVVFVIGMLVTTAVAGSAISNAVDASTDGASQSAGGDSYAGDLAQCLDRWNAGTATTWRAQATVLSLSGGTVYINVGPASDYPDKCLVTVVNPGLDSALQFLETGGGPTGAWGFPKSGSASSLPDSVKAWNATMASDGTLMSSE